jgi:hypothetical protein
MQNFASSSILGGMDMGTGTAAAVGAAALEMDYATPPFLPGMSLTVTPDGKNYGSPIAGLMGQEVTNIGLEECCKRPDTRRNYYTVTTGREDEKPVIVPESVLKPTAGSSESAELEEGEVGEDGGEDRGEDSGEEGSDEEGGEEGSDEKDNSDDAFEEAMDEANGAVEEARIVKEDEVVVDVYEEAHVVNEGDVDVDDIYEETRAVNKADIEEDVKEVVEEAAEDDRSDEAAKEDRSDKEAVEEVLEDNGSEPPVPLMALEELQEHVDVGADAIEAKRRAICAAADAERRAAKEAYDAACAAIDEKWAAHEAAELGPMVELQSFKSQCLAFKHAVSHSNAATASHKRKRDEVECELATARLAEQTAQEEICALREENVDLMEKNKRLKTINDTYYQELKTIS